MNVSERREQILYLLDVHESISVSTLSKILYVSEKTVRNDIDKLSLSFPIIVERGRYGGVRLLKSLPKRKLLSKKQYDLLLKLSVGLSGEDYITIQSILNEVSIY